VDHAHAQLAVVEQQGVSRLDRLEDLRMGQEHALGRADVLVRVEAEQAAFAEKDAAAFDLADAELRPLQVAQDADGALELHLSISHGRVQLARGFVRRMAHVDAEHVDAALEQALQHLRIRGCGPERCDDLDPAITPHLACAPASSGLDSRMVQSLASPVSTSKKPVRLYPLRWQSVTSLMAKD